MTVNSEELKKNNDCEEGSFIYSLHEKNYFDEDQFWKYYNCILNLSTYYKDKNYDSNITKMIIHTYNYILKSLIWHFSPNDLNSISNIPIVRLHLFVERLSMRVEYSYFGKEVIDEEGFNEELINPYYTTS
jgi:hypothetical protein